MFARMMHASMEFARTLPFHAMTIILVRLINAEQMAV
jgi:hypothetical protein